MPAWRLPDNVRQACAVTVAVAASYHTLLLVDIDCNCTTTGFEVCASTVSCNHVRK